MKTKIPEKLYHGTCRAFVAYALQHKGRFGSEIGTSFTPDLEHAKTFAGSWNKARGVQRLREYFDQSIDDLLPELSKPIILQFEVNDLGCLRYRTDCGRDEYFVEGQVDINKAIPIDQ